MDFKSKNDLISRNVQSIELSGIRKFYNKVADVPGAISLTLGQPDFEVPSKIKEAMGLAILENKTQYTANAGTIELREEISKYLKKMNIQYGAEEICITVGGSEAITSAFATLLNSGDTILVPNPAYPAYESCAKLLGAKVISYRLKEDFSIDFQALENLIIEESPKAIVVSYPSNPTGAILSKEARDTLYRIIKKHNIIVISDEIYSSIYFKENYYSISQMVDIKDNIILVNGFSKMFSMTGLRIGYVCASKMLMDGIIKVHQYNVSCASSIGQYGAYEGLKNCMEDVNYMNTQFIKRKEYLNQRLLGMGFEVIVPEGAFYAFPSIKKFKMDSETFCERILREAKVAIVPGTAFGAGGEGYVRISYCYGMDVLKESLDRIEKWIKENI